MRVLLTYQISVFLLFFCGFSHNKIIDLSDLDAALPNELLYSSLYNQSVEWGVYKPDLYFGVRNRQDKPLSFGMFWYSILQNPDDVNISYPYVMDQGVTGYYQFNDGTSASRQIIQDEHRQMQFQIEFDKELEEKDSDPGKYISRWSAKIKINKYNDLPDIKGYPVFFVAKEGKINNEKGVFTMWQNTRKDFHKVQHLVDPTNNIYEIIEIGAASQIDENSMLALQVEEDLTWQVDKIWRDGKYAFLNWHGIINTTTPNIVFIKPQQTIDGFELIVRYSKQSFKQETDANIYSEIMEKDIAVVLKDFDTQIQNKETTFNNRYLQIFGNGFKDFIDTMPNALQFGRETLSNLLGGIGYFYGPIRILDEADPSGKTWFYDNPAGLFTGTPSRPYFPRGFLWDEGFHSQLTCQWSKMLCMDIISHWFNSIKDNGWIPREQMRGKEAESNLNWELVEDPKAGNPPSFMFVLQYLVSSIETNQDQRVINFLTNVFPRVELWFSWFNTTLANTAPNLIGTYMWRDVYQEGALSSGLDDYPRGFRVSQKGNVHADLQIWMITFSKFMAQFIDDIEGIIHKPISQKTSDDYRNLASLASQQLRVWCYNPENGLYTDRIFYEENPPTPQIEENLNLDKYSYLQRRVLEKKQNLQQTSNERKYLQSQEFSPHQGIVNLFPVAFNMFQGDSQRLEDALKFGVDPHTLFSPYGLRGVSERDTFYFPGTGYWRGPVWISVNYLVLRGLYKYYLEYVPLNPLSEDGSIKTPKDFYLKLRKNLVQTVYDNWVPQHLFYENFNDVTGKGQYSHPFTGWTTLILLIMNERYI